MTIVATPSTAKRTTANANSTEMKRAKQAQQLSCANALLLRESLELSILCELQAKLQKPSSSGVTPFVNSWACWSSPAQETQDLPVAARAYNRINPVPRGPAVRYLEIFSATSEFHTESLCGGAP